MVTRHKPTTEQRQATHRATEEDYSKLAEAVVRAVILRQKNVILKFPYFVTLSDDMPKGILVKKTNEHNFYKAKAEKLANWLHMRGHLPADYHGIVLSMRQITYKIADINKMLDGNVKVCDNDVSGGSEQKEEKNGSDDETTD